MPNINDHEELETIKKIHGFEPPVPINNDLTEEEREDRWRAKNKNIKNQAR